jgi:hypothetical protein
MYTDFWSQNLKGRYNLEDLGVIGRIILEWILEKQGGSVWDGFIWFRIETSGGVCLLNTVMNLQVS